MTLHAIKQKSNTLILPSQDIKHSRSKSQDHASTDYSFAHRFFKNHLTISNIIAMIIVAIDCLDEA
jgi:hypothetical protein